MVASGGGSFRKTAGPTWIAIAIAAIAILSASRIWLIPAHFSLDPNEGWNAFQAARALGSGPLYPRPDALTGNNYPPLSFFLVGWAGRLIGDPIVAGRIVALIALLVVAACIFAAVRRFGAHGGYAPAIAALLFLGFNATFFRGYLGMNDPQWFAHALMMLGFLALLPDRADALPAAANVAAAALLMVLGGLAKHNLVAFPLAATIWLALYHRRGLAIWIGTAAGALLLASAFCYRAWGPDFFTDLFAADRHYSLLRMTVKSLPVVALTAPLLVVSAGLVRRRRSDSRLDLLLLAVAIAVPLGIVQRSGQGVDRNAHFEALIALCLAGGAALAGRDTSFGKAVFRQPLAWLIAPLLILAPATLMAGIEEIAERGSEETSWSQMESRIAGVHGMVACETLALCYWAGKDFEIDFFLYGQRAALRHDAAALRQALDIHRFAAIETESLANAPPKPGEIANPILPMIDDRYRVIFSDDDDRRLLEPNP